MVTSRDTGAFGAVSGLQVEEERRCGRKLPKTPADHSLWCGQPEAERARFRERVRELWEADDRREEGEREERRRKKVEWRRWMEETAEERAKVKAEKAKKRAEEVRRRVAEKVESRMRAADRCLELSAQTQKAAAEVTHQQCRQRCLLRSALLSLRAAQHREEAWRLQVAVPEAEDKERRLELWKSVVQQVDESLREVDSVGYPFEPIAARLKGLCRLRLARMAYPAPRSPSTLFTRGDTEEYKAALCELNAAAGFGDASVRKVAPKAYRTWCVDLSNVEDEDELDPVVIVSAVRGSHCIDLERERFPRVVVGARTDANLFGWGLFAWTMMDEVEEECQLLSTRVID
ncbi:hypothetical protein EDD11_010127, partial [Mortierella claussenii]